MECRQTGAGPPPPNPLVSRSWAKAAAAATTDIVVTCSDTQVTCFSKWLKRHAANVCSISITRRQPRGQNSCTPLKLRGDLLTRLTTLHLRKCPAQVYSAKQCVMMPALQTLALHKAPTSRKFLKPLLLPHLTALELSDTQPDSLGGSRNGGALQLLSSLTNLQSFVLTGDLLAAPTALSYLCSSLTSLSITPTRMDGSFKANLVPAAGWPLLKQLPVTNTGLQPQLLTRLTGLEVLHLDNCRLKVAGADDFGPVNTAEEAAAAGVAEFLSALSQLTELKVLELHGINLHALADLRRSAWLEQLGEGPLRPANYLERYSSLFASTKLERLVLVYRDTGVSKLPLPRHVLGHIFDLDDDEDDPPVQLPHLTELVIDGLCWVAMQHVSGPKGSFLEWEHSDEYIDSDAYSEDADLEYDDEYWQHWCVDFMDLKPIARACPKLRRLTLNSVLGADSDDIVAVDIPKALRKLQRHLQLEHLCLGGPWLTTASSAAVASMTSLTHLELYNAPFLRANGLQQLTQLRGLRALQVEGVGRHRGVTFTLDDTAPAGKAPDVWWRLSGHVDRIRQEMEGAGVEDYVVAPGAFQRENYESVISDSEEEAADAGYCTVLGLGLGGCYEARVKVSKFLESASGDEGQGEGEESDGSE